MIRPNAILCNVIQEDGNRLNVVFIRLEDGSYTNTSEPYIKTNDVSSLGPFVNWLDYIPNCEWVHPVYAISDDSSGWFLNAFDTYNEVRWKNQKTTLKKLHDDNQLFMFFDSVLDYYKNMSDLNLEKELNIGKL